jgi:hypothetical protein
MFGRLTNRCVACLAWSRAYKMHLPSPLRLPLSLSLSSGRPKKAICSVCLAGTAACIHLSAVASPWASVSKIRRSKFCANHGQTTSRSNQTMVKPHRGPRGSVRAGRVGPARLAPSRDQDRHWHDSDKIATCTTRTRGRAMGWAEGARACGSESVGWGGRHQCRAGRASPFNGWPSRPARVTVRSDSDGPTVRNGAVTREA